MYEYMILMMPKKNQTRLLQRLSIASRLIQGCFNKHSKVKHCFKINSRSSKQDQEKDKALVYLLKESHWLISFGLKQIIFNNSKALVINYQTL